MAYGPKPVIPDWIREQQGKHHCICGCEKPIEIKKHHYAKGIPEYIRGHAHTPQPTHKMVSRFWDKVDFEGECREWQGLKNPAGYGRVGFQYQSLLAHRVSWMMTNGPVPPGLFVLHACDNPGCVRPSHLFLGDDAANHKDMVDKGRSTRGEKNAQSKITIEIVREIRQRSANGETHHQIAERYGVSRHHVTNILNRRRWAHVP